MHKFTWEKMIPKHECQTKCFQCMAEIQNQGWKVAVVQMASKGVSSANFVIYRWKLWLPTLGNEIKKRGQIIAVCLLATNLRYFFHKSRCCHHICISWYSTCGISYCRHNPSWKTSKFDQNPVGGICSTGIRSPILSILDLNRDGRGEGRPASRSPQNYYE